jgi:integrase/recombinase XerC
VDLVAQRVLVGLPNKTMTERYAPFSEKTKRYFLEWMSERDPECGHDRVLHNSRGNPCLVLMLIDNFKRVLCKTYRGKKVNEVGLDEWSTHRLRHTMVPNLVSAGADVATVMNVGGWKSPDAMAGYAKPDMEVARKGYDQAMEKSRRKRSQRSRPISPAEFLARRAQEKQSSAESSSCPPSFLEQELPVGERH